MSVVLYEVNNGVATITLNRPDSLNSMSTELMAALSEAAEKVEADQSVRVAVLTGAGRGFCSGADLAAAAEREPGETPGSGDTDIFNDAIRRISSLPVPTVARVNGPAAGGGFGLALSCDITIAARSAFFVATFGPRLGIVPDMGVTWFLPHRIGQARARGLTMLGDRISADQAKEWGLIWEAVDDDHLDEAVGEIARRLSRTSPDAMTRIRQTIDAAPTTTLSDQLDLEMSHQQVLIPKNMVEGATAFMEKREPKFDGERQQS